MLIMPQYQDNKVLLMLEGVTGSGKTTLAKILSDQISEISIIPEPFDRWNNIHGTENLFAMFLQDKSRWGLTFQNYVFFTHYQALQAAYTHNSNKNLFITDRSYFSGMLTFTRILFDTHQITTMEWEIYQESSWWFVKNLPYRPNGFIYLKVSPKTSCARANQRNRKLNDSLQLSYFEALYRYHEEWLIEKKNIPEILREVPVLIIDGEVDFKNDAKAQSIIIAQVKDFVAQLKNA